jgi:hypothetical protein
MKDKEQAREHFIDVILHSWTYLRLTENERSKFWDVLPQNLKGTYLQRYETCNNVYGAYLQGLGYKPIGWRD